MPTDAEETVAKEVLYPDDLSGETLEIDPDGLLDGGLAFWNADGDAEALPDGAKRGWWLPVDSAEHGQVWASMPGDLREQMVDADLGSGDIIEVVSMKKQGGEETSPWKAEMAVVAE